MANSTSIWEVLFMPAVQPIAEILDPNTAEYYAKDEYTKIDAILATIYRKDRKRFSSPEVIQQVKDEVMEAIMSERSGVRLIGQPKFQPYRKGGNLSYLVKLVGPRQNVEKVVRHAMDFIDIYGYFK
jgi:hypothetical protein